MTNFDSDLCDSLALAALLISHWPELASFVSQLKLSPGNQAGMRYNAGTLVKMMEELQLPWTLQVPFYFLLSSVAIFKSMGVQNRLSIGGEWFVLHADVLCCAVLCCAVLCCAVLCCAVLCCAVLCCAVAQEGLLHILYTIGFFGMLSAGGGDHQTRLKRYGAAGAVLVPDHTPAPPQDHP